MLSLPWWPFCGSLAPGDPGHGIQWSVGNAAVLLAHTETGTLARPVQMSPVGTRAAGRTAKGCKGYHRQ
jgi:hypothetical protein